MCLKEKMKGWCHNAEVFRAQFFQIVVRLKIHIKFPDNTVQQFSGSKITQKRHIVVLIGFCALIPNLGSKLKSYERFSHNSRKNRGKSIFCGFSYKKYKETRYRHSDFFNWKNIILGSYCKRKNEKKLKIGLLAEF